MRKIKTFSEFFDVTGMIDDRDDIAFLGLSCDFVNGAFWPSSMEPVLEFCRNNPTFHITTHVGEGIFVNRFQESGKLFFIAEGDASPDIWYDNSTYYRRLFF